MKNITLRPYPHYIYKNCLVENAILTSEHGNPKIQGFKNE